MHHSQAVTTDTKNKLNLERYRNACLCDVLKSKNPIWRALLTADSVTLARSFVSYLLRTAMIVSIFISKLRNKHFGRLNWYWLSAPNCPYVTIFRDNFRIVSLELPDQNYQLIFLSMNKTEWCHVIYIIWHLSVNALKLLPTPCYNIIQTQPSKYKTGVLASHGKK